MRIKISEHGVVIPKEFFEGATEVDIRKQNGIIVVVPTEQEDASGAPRQTLHQARSWADIPKNDPIYDIGKNPVTLDITDASENLDRYIYGAE